MTKTEDEAVDREIKTMHNEWAERRAERDLQAAIRLENLATWTMFHIASDTDVSNKGWILSDGKWIRKFSTAEGGK